VTYERTNYKIVPAEEKGFTLFYRGIEIGTAKLHCDAVLTGKDSRRRPESGCKTYRIGRRLYHPGS
jgi:hypothetical protein